MATNKRIGKYILPTTSTQSGIWQIEDLYTSTQGIPIQNGLQFYIDPALSSSYSTSTINKFSYPVDIYSFVSSAGANNCTFSRDTSTISPIGNSPLKMVVTGTDPYIGMYNGAAYNVAPASIGQTWTVSVYVKADAPTTAQLFMMEANSTGGYLASNNTITPIGTSWTRISTTYTLTQATTAYVQVRLDGPDNGELRTLWWDGLEVEQSSTMSDFTAGPTKAIDLSSNGRNATLINSPTITGNSFTFLPGLNQYISCGNFGSFYSQGTISFWMNSTDVSNYRNPIHSHFQGVNTGFRFEQAGSTGSSGTMGMLFGNDAGGNTGHQFGTLSFDTWYQITVTWNTSTNIAVGYVNGSQVFNEANTTWSTQIPSLTVGGGFSSSPERWYSGGIGAVMLYNRALSATEVAQNYAALNGRYGSITTTIPSAPTIGSVTRTSNTGLTLAYTDNQTGGRYIQGHYVVCSPVTNISVTAQGNPLTVYGSFTQGQAYTFTVNAYNQNGYSGMSGISSSITPYPATPPPIIAVTPPIIAVTPPIIAVTPPIIAVTPPIIAVTPPIIAVTPPIIAVTPPIIAVTPPIIAVTPPIIAVTPPPPCPACRPACPTGYSCSCGICIG
jgi:hypothetical protein